MASGLSYDDKPTWRSYPPSAGWVKFCGVCTFSLACAYLLGFHAHNKPMLYQAPLAAIAAGLAILLLSRWSDDNKLRDSFKLIVVAQGVVQAVMLLNFWERGPR